VERRKGLEAVANISLEAGIDLLAKNIEEKTQKDLTIFIHKFKKYSFKIFTSFRNWGRSGRSGCHIWAILDATVIRNLKSVHIFFKFLNHEQLLSLFRVLFKIFLA